MVQGGAIDRVDENTGVGDHLDCIQLCAQRVECLHLLLALLGLPLRMLAHPVLQLVLPLCSVGDIRSSRRRGQEKRRCGAAQLATKRFFCRESGRRPRSRTPDSSARSARWQGQLNDALAVWLQTTDRDMGAQGSECNKALMQQSSNGTSRACLSSAFE